MSCLSVTLLLHKSCTTANAAVPKYSEGIAQALYGATTQPDWQYNSKPQSMGRHWSLLQRVAPHASETVYNTS